MKKVFVLEWHENQFWLQGELKQFINDKLIKKWDINNYYSVGGNYFYIYDTVGGSGTGFRRGEILHKIDISNAEYSKKEL